MGCCTPTAQKWSGFSVTLLFLIIGSFILIFKDPLYNSILKHELSVADINSKGFAMWHETPIPMFMRFYLWNFTNAEEVIKSNWKIKPKLEQCGPYVFSEHHTRENITFNDNNDTVTFKNKRVWHFVAGSTNGTLQDKITTVNPILLAVSNSVRFNGFLLRKFVSFLITEKSITLTVTKTVKEFLFDGYEDRLLSSLRTIGIKNIPFDKFGWFYARNNSIDYDGVFNMFTGADDIEKMGRLQAWNYNPNVSFYRGNCGKVEGTTGELWYPPKDDNTIKVFANDFCSDIALELTAKGSVYNGIEGREYKAQATVFDNGTLHPEMACYKPDGVKLNSGVRNVSECKFNSPAFISFPHFYSADPAYRKAVDGMNPNPDLHQFYIVLEPETGTPLHVNAALQVNLKIEPIRGISILDKVATIYMPMLWFQQTAELTEPLADQVKVLLTLPSVMNYTGSIIVGIAILLCIFTLYLLIKNAWFIFGDEEPLINQESF